MKSIVSAILVMLFCNTVFSQINTNATLNTGGGSSLSFAGFTLDWNIGETTVIDSYSSPNPFSNLPLTSYLYVTCGVLQPLDNSRLFYNGNIPTNANWTSDEVRLLPVPTKDLVTIDFRSYTTGKISVFLMDNTGLLLRKNTFSNFNSISKQVWDLSMYKTGIYFFHIVLQNIDDNTIIKTGAFQVIKL